jgi:hypothetical protein
MLPHALGVAREVLVVRGAHTAAEPSDRAEQRANAGADGGGAAEVERRLLGIGARRRSFQKKDEPETETHRRARKRSEQRVSHRLGHVGVTRLRFALAAIALLLIRRDLTHGHHRGPRTHAARDRDRRQKRRDEPLPIPMDVRHAHVASRASTDRCLQLESEWNIVGVDSVDVERL